MDQTKFIEGSIVYLRRPDIEQDVMQGHWHDWFNDYEITKYLVHGTRPISREEEREIVEAELSNPRSLLFAVCRRDTEEHIGICGLKGIDHANRTAEINIVMGPRPPVGSALEAMALVTKHAFDRLNLHHLYAGQHEGLWKWVNTLTLIGYELEGYRPAMGWRDGKPYGTMLTGVLAPTFYALQEARGGSIMTDDIPALLQTRPRTNPIARQRSENRWPMHCA